MKTPETKTPDMKKPEYGDNSPIAALATPMSESALAIIRLCGNRSSEDERDGSIELLAKIFSNSKKLLSAKGNSLIYGWIAEPQESSSKKPPTKIDQVIVSVYRAPHSYTGEDAAEISCHGSIAVINAILSALKRAGFRDALPGEFTFRAFMNGKLDLTRAESVMELVSSKTGKGREQAIRRLSGLLEKEISSIKELLMNVLAGAEIFLDYSEDEFSGSHSDEEAGVLPGKDLAKEAMSRLKILSNLWQQERIYSEASLVVLAGRPNAGKSSLFNYVLKEDRSIVTNSPGTTRDWIEALISINDIPVNLSDTAGLRNPGNAPDEAEQIGIEKSNELMRAADLILYVINGPDGITGEDNDFLEKFRQDGKKTIVLWNKTDIAPFSEKFMQDELFLKWQPHGVSAKTGEGIPALLDRIADSLLSPIGAEPELSAAGADPEKRHSISNNTGPGTVRQKDLIQAALLAVEEALLLAEREEPLDIIAPLFRTAINALGEITGEVFTDDILELMFSRFCVGK